MVRKLFPFWGAEGDDDGDGDGGDGPDPIVVDGTQTPSTRTLTAEEIEAMVARAADRSSRKARKDLAGELGFEDLSKLKDFVSAKLEADKEALDEKDRAILEANQAKEEAEALRNNLASDRLDNAVLRHVVSAGVTDEKKLNRITALIRLDLDSDVVNDEDTWDEAITEALSSVREDAPELFSGSKPGFGSGDGGARGGSAPASDDEAAKKKKLQEQFAGQGLVEYNPDSF